MPLARLGARALALALLLVPSFALATSPPVLSTPSCATGDNPCTVSGTAPAGSTVTMYVEGEVVGTVVAHPSTGAFSYPTPLFDGWNDVDATATLAGDTSALSNTLALEYVDDITTRTLSNPTISANTVWTAGASSTPFVITGTLTINSGSYLVIQPGTTLKFTSTSSRILANGKLWLHGSASSQVVLTSSAASPARGNWTGVVVNAAGSVGSVIEWTKIEYANRAIETTGATSVMIEDSLLREFTNNGVNATTGATLTVARCTIDQSAGTKAGTGIGLDTVVATIDANLIKKTNAGILVNKSSPSITGNTARDGTYGVKVEIQSSPSITGNVLTANNYGMYVTGNASNPAQNPSPVANYNQIYGNTTDDYLASAFGANANWTTLDAKNNWWGSTDPVAIAENIQDATDSTTSPVVDYTPFLNAANGTPVSGTYLNGVLANGLSIPGSNHQVVGSLRIPAGATVTIAAGATLRFVAGAAFEVAGTLLVQGSNGSNVVMNSFDPTPARGDWDGIILKATSTGTVLEYLTIEYAHTGINAFAAFVLRNSVIREVAPYGVYVNPGVVATIETSTIDNSAGAKTGNGIHFEEAGAGSTIASCLVKKFANGIHLDASSPAITGTTVRDSTTGIHVGTQSSPAITAGNVLTANNNGIYVQGSPSTPSQNPNPIVNGNEFYANTQSGIYAASFGSAATSTVLDVTGNWWGSTSTVEISDDILDHTDTTSNPTIAFTPFLDGPSGSPVSGNYLNGPLAPGTTLSAASPYEVVGAIRVPSGATVTIPAGVTLRFVPKATVHVDGTLLVTGTAASPVLMTSLKTPVARGDWQGISANTGSTGTTIEHATIEHAHTGVDVYANAVVRESTLREFLFYGVNVRSGAVVTVEDSSLDQSAGVKGGTGVNLDTGAAGTVISENVIRKAFTGIYTIRTSPTITGNDIRDCTNGIDIKQLSSPTITSGNVITANTQGIYVQGSGAAANNPMPVINGNELRDNTSNNLITQNFGNPSTTTLNAEANYWGSTNTATIAAKIQDYTDASGSPVVDFSPFLDANGNPVGGSTYLSGILSGSTTLTGGSTYDVVGSVIVASGASLTIPSATTLRFAYDTKIVVEGTLTITGTSGSPVLLRSAAASPLRGDWDGILIQASAAGATIEYATIEHVTRGVDAFAAFTLRNSTIREFSQQAIYVRPTVVGTIETNTIDNSSGAKAGVGIYLDTAGSGTTIDENLIRKTNDGIFLVRSSPAITANTIQDGTDGIEITDQSAPAITTGNLITANQYGIRVVGTGSAATNPAPTINGNAIHGNTTYDLQATAFGTTAPTIVVDAQNNWWGSAVASTVASEIYDQRFAGTSPVVDWAPHLASLGGSPVSGNFIDRPIAATTSLAAGNEYVVTSKIAVATGATLTVPDDVTLKFVGSAALAIHGVLDVNGTASDPALFTSAAASPVRGDWKGLYIHATSVGSELDHAVVEYAEHGLHVIGTDVDVDESEFRHFPNLTFPSTGAGIFMESGAGGTVSNTLIDNGQLGGDVGVCVWIADSSPTITASTVQNCQEGIYLVGDSAPLIDGGTLITSNTRGLRIDGAGAAGLPQPDPTVHGISIHGNGSNVWVQSYYNPSGTASLDLTGNWWGSTSPTTIAGSFVVNSPGGSTAVQIDFSNFLDGAGGTPIVAARFLNVLSAVTRSHDVFNPIAPESVAIGFNLAVPATVALTICAEADLACATPIRSYSQSFGAGTQSFAWDGKDTGGNYVPHTIYAYKLVATDGVADGVNEGTFNPTRPSGSMPIGVLSSMTPTYNPHRNEGVIFAFDMPSPQWVVLQRIGTPMRPALPFLAGHHEFLWNGRDAAGNIAALGNGPLSFATPVPAKPNIVMVEGTEPTIYGIGATPLVEVKSNPYLVVRSYEQIANITYRIDQDCYVTVKLLPPGVNDFASASAVLMTPTTLLAARTGSTPNDHLATWAGYVPASPREAYFSDEGTYTFAIQATSATTGLTSLYRGALQLRR